MKILILLKKWDGGVGTVVKHISEEFKKKGHEVKIISREDDLEYKNLASSIYPLRQKIENLIKKENFDIIYAQDWSLAFPFIFPTKIFRKKLFCVFYGENPKKTLFIQKWTGKKIGKNLIVCNDNLKEMLPLSTLIYNRVDPDFFSPSNKIKREKNTVGFANWKTNEYRFEDIKNAVEKAKMKLVVAEGISKDKMPDFFRKIEYFISLPPSYAGFGLVYLEAMASGVQKIIGSNYGGGNVLPITKIEDFNGDIVKALQKAKSKNYRKWILDNKFTWKDAVEKLLKIFKHL